MFHSSQHTCTDVAAATCTTSISLLSAGLVGTLFEEKMAAIWCPVAAILSHEPRGSSLRWLTHPSPIAHIGARRKRLIHLHTHAQSTHIRITHAQTHACPPLTRTRTHERPPQLDHAFPKANLSRITVFSTHHRHLCNARWKPYHASRGRLIDHASFFYKVQHKT